MLFFILYKPVFSPFVENLAIETTGIREIRLQGRNWRVGLKSRKRLKYNQIQSDRVRLIQAGRVRIMHKFFLLQW